MNELSPITKDCKQVLSLSHIIYSKHRPHITMEAYMLDVMSRHHMNMLLLYLQITIKNIILHTLFTGPRFDTCSCLSQITSCDSPSRLLPISALFVSVFTLTNLGGCQGIQLGITNQIYHQENIKYYSINISPPIVSHYLFTLLIFN